MNHKIIALMLMLIISGFNVESSDSDAKNNITYGEFRAQPDFLIPNLPIVVGPYIPSQQTLDDLEKGKPSYWPTSAAYRQGFCAEELKSTKIQWVNDAKGYGLFAIKEIPANQIIGEYTGLKFLSRYDDPRLTKGRYVLALFAYNLATGKIGQPDMCKLTEYRISTDAEHYRNETAFINSSTHPNVVFGFLPPDQIGITTNPPIFAATTRAILAGEEILADYGEGYWRHKNITPIE